jgi:ribosome maturation factor RimP
VLFCLHNFHTGRQRPVVVSEAGAARFFVGPKGEAMHQIQRDIEARLAERAPDVDVLLAEVSGETVRLFIDHPDGVTLELCERVTHLLPEVREDYALEVSSPGIERPLSKPDHFRRFLGRRARVRTREARDGHRSFTGELVGASEAEVTIAAPTGVVAIPYGDIARSNLVEE